jgi:hypothetical protein
MAPQFDRALRERLRTAGCLLVRQGKGSHEIWHSPLTKRNFLSVPSVGTLRIPSCGRRDCRRHFDRRRMHIRHLTVALALVVSPAAAQDVRGLEVCTAEKDMTRRTSCLQANVEFLQRELTRQARRAQDDRAFVVKEITTLKAEIVGLKILLNKAQDEIVALRKKAAEKK